MTIRGFHQLSRSSTTAVNFYAACANALRHVAHPVCSFQVMVILDSVPVCRITTYEYMQCIRYVLRAREATTCDREEVGAKITMRLWWCAKLHQDAYATQSTLDVEQTICYSSNALHIQPMLLFNHYHYCYCCFHHRCSHRPQVHQGPSPSTCSRPQSSDHTPSYALSELQLSYPQVAPL
jgi:hypothetical protein